MLRALTLAVFLTAATTTQAAIITSSYMNSLVEVPFDKIIRQTMTLNMFDSSLGTLNYAILTHQIEGQASLILDNDSPASVTFDYYDVLIAETELFYSAPIIGVDLSQYGVTLAAGESQDFGTYGGPGGGGGMERIDDSTFGCFPDFSECNPTLPSLSKLGGGTFETGCQLSHDNRFFPDAPEQIEASAVTWGACGTTIEYHFTKASVPEPSAILLFGIGLVGLVGFSKRRKAV